MTGKQVAALRALVGSVLYGWVGEAPVGPVKRGVLRALSRKALRPVAMSAGASRSYPLQPASSFVVASPAFVGVAPLIREGRFPELRAHLVEDAVVSPYASAVVQGDRLLVPDIILKNRQRHSTDGGNLYWLGQRNCVGRIIRQETVAEGLLIGGAGAFNWYHFVMECLPKAFLARGLPGEMKDWPLLVPEECTRVPGFAQALKLFSGDRPVRPVPRGAALHVGRAVTFDEVNYGPFNLYDGSWPDPDDYSQHDDTLRQYTSALRAGLLGSDPRPVPVRRIFLVRPATRRNYNQDALVEIAGRYGFEAHAPEKLPLAEQAALFADAGMVIGASGAAWVGMAFCAPGTQMLSWLPREYAGFCCYSTLANLLGHRMRFVNAIPDRLLKDTADAFDHSYRLDEGDFEAALQYMTGGEEALASARN